MTEETKEHLDRRKVLGVFGLAAGAASAATLLNLPPSKTPEAAVVGGRVAERVSPTVQASGLTSQVSAPASTSIHMGTDGSISSIANKVTQSKVSTPGSVSKKVTSKNNSASTPPDTAAERRERTANNQKLAKDKAAAQTRNERAYKAKEAEAQKVQNQKYEAYQQQKQRAQTTDKTVAQKIEAEQKKAFIAPTVAAIIAPNLRINGSDEWHLARRASLGANKLLVDEITQVGYSKWIDNQLDHLKVEDEFCQRLARKYFPVSFMTQKEIFHHSGKEPGQSSRLDMSAGYFRQALSKRVIFESMVEFWRDHMHVKQTSDKNVTSVVHYDQTVRELAMGKFKDLLYGTLTHPAMLHYLDNQNSRKANPNQNLGRELLELHTLGAGNHTENDVLEASKMLTGHSTATVDSAREYRWQPSYHATGKITLSTGFTHPNTSTVEAEAKKALRAMTDHLAVQRPTALKIAHRLCLRFVSDTPPQALVNDLANVYLANDTDIKPVLKTLFNHRLFKAAKGAKWRRPAEVSASMLKSIGVYDMFFAPNWVRNHSVVLSPVRARMATAGHEFQQWETPDGFPDVASHWMAPTINLALWNATEVWANQSINSLHYLSWEQVLGVNGQMDAWFIVDQASQYMYGMKLPFEERKALAGYLATGDDLKWAPEWVGVGDSALKARLKNMMRLVFCNPRMMVR